MQLMPISKCKHVLNEHIIFYCVFKYPAQRANFEQKMLHYGLAATNDHCSFFQ